MNFRYYYFVLLFVSFNSFGKSFIEGKVIEEGSENLIPFVNIGVVNKEEGTVSNVKGYFTLDISVLNDNDTILFSSIGYESKTIVLSDLKNYLKYSNLIILQPIHYELEEIVIMSDNSSYELISGNGKGKKRIHAGMGQGDKLGSEYGVVIKNQGSFSVLRKIFLNIAINNYQTFNIRVNIYDYDGNEPTSIINKVPIIMEIPGNAKGILVLDLSDYEIIVNNDFIVSLEYIENLGEYGFYLHGVYNKNPTFMRIVSQGSWKRWKHKGKDISLGIDTLLDVYN